AHQLPGGRGAGHRLPRGRARDGGGRAVRAAPELLRRLRAVPRPDALDRRRLGADRGDRRPTRDARAPACRLSRPEAVVIAHKFLRGEQQLSAESRRLPVSAPAGERLRAPDDRLGLLATVAIVVGGIVGTGIFTVPAAI